MLGLLAIVARFSSRVVGGRTRLPAVIDRSVGMWAIRRLRSGHGGDTPRATVAPPPPTAGPELRAERGHWPVLTARRRRGRGRAPEPFAATTERLTAIGARRAVPLPRPVPTARSAARLPLPTAARPAPRMSVARPAPSRPSPSGSSQVVPSQAWSSRIARPRAEWSSRGPVSAARPALAPQPGPSVRSTIQARYIARVATLLVIGLIGLVGAASIFGPSAPGGGVLGATGQPEGTRPIATQAVPSGSPSPRP